MRQFVIRDFWLKALALFLAVIVWLYVVGELNKGTPEEKTLFEQMLPYRLAAKELPIRPVLTGKPRAGYMVLVGQVAVKPSTCVVMAPRDLLKNISHIATEDINISEVTRSVVKEVKIRPQAVGVRLEKAIFIKVFIPVRKIE